MTDDEPTPATPLWRPAGADVPSTDPYRPSGQGAPQQQYGPDPWPSSRYPAPGAGFPPPASGYPAPRSGFPPAPGHPMMPAPGQYPSAWQPLPPVAGAKLKPTPLPVAPKRYHQFLQTPRRRWWKVPVALVFGGVVWFIASIVVVLPAMFYDVMRSGARSGQQIADYLSTYTQSTTPAFFIANNVSIAMM
ncbi:MAG TPA: hypothetical protein VFK68_12185, partial [Propionibacteriaceae bacterium]|nr:hypothetical protein [Propionibacteriaceae bacterium]